MNKGSGDRKIASIPMVLVGMGAFAQGAWAGTGCDTSASFAMDNVVGGISCDVSAIFSINNVIPELMCDVSATFAINNTGGPIPTVSQWGIIVLSLLTLTTGTVVFRRRRPQPRYARTIDRR